MLTGLLLLARLEILVVVFKEGGFVRGGHFVLFRIRAHARDTFFNFFRMMSGRIKDLNRYGIFSILIGAQSITIDRRGNRRGTVLHKAFRRASLNAGSKA
jgi:hypothetical protein